MSKTWIRSDEWVSVANCGSDSRFLIPPERLSAEDADEIEYLCHTCPVRPECLRTAVDSVASGVWCASVFIPEISLDDTPRAAKEILIQAEEIRLRLAKTIPEEMERRGEF